MGALLRAPALHFLVLGALLFALAERTAPSAGATARPPIVITAARIADIRDDYRSTVLADPTQAELEALVAREADEEMLYREALLLGLDRGDRAIEWRIIEKVRFLYGDAAGDDREAYRRGVALGLDRDDPVVRSALVTKMRLLAKAASLRLEPRGPALERELEAYRQRHGEAYAQAERLSLTHVFLNASRRGAGLEADARALARELRESHVRPEAAARRGDPFPAGNVVRDASRSAIAKLLGDAFADTAFGLAPERWSDPIRSPYGLHLVWISARDPAGTPALDAIRPRVLRAYRAEQRARYLARMMDELRAAYEVRIEHEPPTS